jgi:integrase
MARRKQNEGEQQESKSQRVKKRGQGEGSIYQCKDERWVSEVQLGYSNGKRDRKFVYGKTGKEVADKLTDLLNKHKQGLPIIAEKQTVKQFLEDWIENIVKPTTRTSTYLSYKQKIRLHIVPEIGHIKLARLNPQNVQQMVKNLMAKDRQEIEWKKGKKKDAEPKVKEAQKLSNRTVQYSLMVLSSTLSIVKMRNPNKGFSI